MTFTQVLYFFQTNFWGLIIVSIVSGVLTSIVYDYLKMAYKKTNDKVKGKRLVKQLVTMGNSFSLGARSSLAKRGNTYQQTALVGEYVINTVVHIGWILFYSMLTVAAIIALDLFFIWIPITVFSVLITIRYKKLRFNLMHFRFTYEMAFGKEYLKSENEGVRDYWETWLNENDDTQKAIEKT